MSAPDLRLPRVRVLLVEPPSDVRSRTHALLEQRFDDVYNAPSLARADELATREALLVVDLDLGSDAVDWVARMAVGGSTVVVTSATARGDESFRLARLGVRAYVPKPIDERTLDDALRTALEAPPDLSPYLRALVGLVPIHDVERAARRTMVNEALERARGSKTGAAKILRVSRQLFQHMMKGQKRMC